MAMDPQRFPPQVVTELARFLARLRLGNRDAAARIVSAALAPIVTPTGEIAPDVAADVDHNALSNLTTGDPHTQYQKESEKGVAGGYASLDGGGDVPDAQIPEAIARDAEVTAAIGAHAALPEAHHQQDHTLVGADHTASGLTIGDVLTATGPTTFAFQAPAGGGGGQYRQMVHYNPTPTTFDFLADGSGQPVEVLRSLE